MTQSAKTCGARRRQRLRPLSCRGRVMGELLPPSLAGALQAWADPAVRARMSAAMKKAWAKRAVALAGLPLLKRMVARAEQLFAGGYDIKSVAHVLRREEREREAA